MAAMLCLANVPLKKRVVLLRLDPRPFEFAVKRRKAALAAAEQAVLEQQAALVLPLRQCRARRPTATGQRKIINVTQPANTNRSSQPFSLEQVDNLRKLYLAAEAALTTAEAQAEQARLAATSLIDGADTNVTQLEAELARALATSILMRSKH